MMDTMQSSADPQTTWESITRAQTKCPAVVLSVIGDSDNFMPHPWPRAAFQTALIEAAKSGGETWILYRKSNHVLSKTVRDAYNTYGNMNIEYRKNMADEINRHIKLIGFISEDQTKDVVQENEYDIVIGDDENLLELEKFLSDQKVPNNSDIFG
uniref:Uncharacterized protein LOC111106287 n=1 Tax=Crassostrea virginica TaxID=6565 RepID=A0A8B8B0R9_CRAVI|nr:uncharacterized protein LOC111106287 [Crassostrea virginica]